MGVTKKKVTPFFFILCLTKIQSGAKISPYGREDSKKWRNY